MHVYVSVWMKVCTEEHAHKHMCTRSEHVKSTYVKTG